MRSKAVLLAVAAVCAAIVVGAAGAAAAPVVEGEEHCVVNVRTDDVLNMREWPSARAPIVARKAYDACGILVTGPCEGDWCPVEDGHSLGWMHRHYLSMVSPARYCVVGVAYNDVLNLRRWPSPRSRILTGIPPDACGIAFLPYRVGNWQKVRTDGWQGWVNSRYLSGQ